MIPRVVPSIFQAISVAPAVGVRAISTGSSRVFVIGVGMTPFEKPGSSGMDYPEMAGIAGRRALEDAKIDFEEVEQASVGYVYGESTSGNRALYEVGLSGIPIFNVNNNCSTGSTALMGVQQLIRGGVADCVMALGFEKMQTGSLSFGMQDRENPVGQFMKRMGELVGPLPKKTPPAPWLFGCAGEYHMEKYGTPAEAFAKIAVKNHKHSVNNPYAQFQEEYTLEDVMASKPIYGPLTMLQCSPTSDGAAAVILASEYFVEAHGLKSRAVEIVGQAMATDTKESFEDPMKLVGSDMTKRAAAKAFAMAKIDPKDIDVVELHDCFSTNELLTYEALGLCAEGEGGAFVADDAQTYGGSVVVNPSGGLISKGHPLGATGLAQCAELTWQLRGEADKRQVDGAELAVQHNLGLGGAAVVTCYRKGF